MATTPTGPRLLKGAIVAVDVSKSGVMPTTTIAFQYNPETLTRTLDPQWAGGEPGQRSQEIRFKGAPKEPISLDVTIDATDQLERGDAATLEKGIYPQLSALEILLYPASRQVIDNNALLDQGQIEIANALYDAPLTLFVWGPKRVLPVVLTSLSVTEEAFDTRLNPIRATVKLSLRALTYDDLDSKHKGYSLFLAYQKAKEQLASELNTADANQAVGFNVGTYIARNAR